MPGQKLITWDGETLLAIMSARQQLVSMGVLRPSIRMVLYLLMELPNWRKKHYDTLTVKLGKWRDEGLIDFGLFADDGAGQSDRPLTTREIVERVRALRDLTPAELVEGVLPVLFVEHIALVDLFSRLLDYRVAVVSSQGQLRREHLWRFMKECMAVVQELGGEGIQMLALTDYDKGGLEIFQAHRRWLRRLFDVELERWAITGDQIRAAGLDMGETHQLDGWLARYGIERVRRELSLKLHL